MTTYEPADWRPEPGDVVEATNQHGTFRCRVSSAGLTLKLSNNGYVTNPSHVRRLLVVDPASVVVLDPDNPDDVERLAEAIKANPIGAWPSVAEAALRSLLPVVTPPEPNGLGAVVEDARFGPIVRTQDGWWIDRSHSRIEFLTDQAEEVLSHGVGCSCGAPDCNGGGQ